MPVRAQQPRLVGQRDERYYVSVMDGGRKGFLLGPYSSHEEALANVERGCKLANEADDRAWFYAYGTCSAPADRTIATVFGQ